MSVKIGEFQKEGVQKDAHLAFMNTNKVTDGSRHDVLRQIVEYMQLRRRGEIGKSAYANK